MAGPPFTALRPAPGQLARFVNRHDNWRAGIDPDLAQDRHEHRPVLFEGLRHGPRVQYLLPEATVSALPVGSAEHVATASEVRPMVGTASVLAACRKPAGRLLAGALTRPEYELLVAD
jgi:hypothetical protein